MPTARTFTSAMKYEPVNVEAIRCEPNIEMGGTYVAPSGNSGGRKCANCPEPTAADHTCLCADCLDEERKLQAFIERREEEERLSNPELAYWENERIIDTCGGL